MSAIDRQRGRFLDRFLNDVLVLPSAERPLYYIGLGAAGRCGRRRAAGMARLHGSVE